MSSSIPITDTARIQNHIRFEILPRVDRKMCQNSDPSFVPYQEQNLREGGEPMTDSQAKILDQILVQISG